MINSPALSRRSVLVGGLAGLLAATTLALNLWTFPTRPDQEGLVDLGPLVGLWLIVVFVQTLTLANLQYLVGLRPGLWRLFGTSAVRKLLRSGRVSRPKPPGESPTKLIFCGNRAEIACRRRLFYQPDRSKRRDGVGAV